MIRRIGRVNVKEPVGELPKETDVPSDFKRRHS